jgi:hypothetical protein
MIKGQALKILDELKNSPNMIKHGLAASFAMAFIYDYFSQKDKNPELTKGDWETVGLLHDADYELTNKSLENHTEETAKKLKGIGVDQSIIEAIRGHCDKVPRKTLMAKAIYAVDELTGLIIACALVQPDKKLKSVSVQSVLKKFKDNSFARGANREEIKTCESELNIPLEEFIEITLKAMQDHSGDLGL